MKHDPEFLKSRRLFHKNLLVDLLSAENGVPSNADKSSKPSVAIATGLLKEIGRAANKEKLPGQTAGKAFEEICSSFLSDTIGKLSHIRPGEWEIGRASSISRFAQYKHLAALQNLASSNVEIAVALGNDYLIKPDIIIARKPIDDALLNKNTILVSDEVSNLTPIRASNNGCPILLASISCKWTLRSDRAQNARSEGLNLVKNRKGRLPNVSVITGEPTPGRLASIALGTGEIDCVYHFALPELKSTLKNLGMLESLETLDMLIEGNRLRDISDLPFDLVA